MSLIQLAADLIRERGHGTVDDILPEMDGYSRDQVIKALNNATQYGLISCDGRGPRRKGAGIGKSTTQPATFRAAERQYTRISSVFDLAHQ
jgi:hypothetical protein